MDACYDRPSHRLLHVENRPQAPSTRETQDTCCFATSRPPRTYKNTRGVRKTLLVLACSRPQDLVSSCSGGAIAWGVGAFSGTGFVFFFVLVDVCLRWAMLLQKEQCVELRWLSFLRTY